jgi:hypothetical protein
MTVHYLASKIKTQLNTGLLAPLRKKLESIILKT